MAIRLWKQVLLRKIWHEKDNAIKHSIENGEIIVNLKKDKRNTIIEVSNKGICKWSSYKLKTGKFKIIVNQMVYYGFICYK